MRNPRVLNCTPELIINIGEIGIKSDAIDLPELEINASTGGLAPIPSTYTRAIFKDGRIDLAVCSPKWESSLKKFNDLSTIEIKKMQNILQDKIYLISHPSFNKVKIEGTNTKMYDDSWRFQAKDRAIAFSAGIINNVIPIFRPDIIWLHDWMVGPVAPVAKAMGIKVVSTGHNPLFTELASFDEMIYKGIELRDSEDNQYTPSKYYYITKGKFDFMASEVNSSDDFTTVSNGYLQRILNGGFDDLAPQVMDAIKKKNKVKHPDGRPRVHGYPNPLKKDGSDLLDSIKLDGLEATILKRKHEGEEIRHSTGLKEGGILLNLTNRLSEHKNPRLQLETLMYFAEKYDLRYLINANGEQKYVDKALTTALESRGYAAYSKFDGNLEKRAIRTDNAYGLMTPNNEPCGGQNINYPAEGTLIIGHQIDGLIDSVHELNIEKSTGNGFPFKNNNKEGLEYGIVKMKEFAALEDKLRYNQLIRIAEETLKNNSSTARAKQLIEEVFLPLYEEKI
ncbi:MAG: glycogen synthase [Candidatus Diapherotrites archaeon ADurb.Bin253]|jgi:starch synthase/alpha-amylase|nr:MAG: glycogen synthase [Candidatus Diapherotrites archaeon ADurb.Bin253]